MSDTCPGTNVLVWYVRTSKVRPYCRGTSVLANWVRMLCDRLKRHTNSSLYVAYLVSTVVPLWYVRTKTVRTFLYGTSVLFRYAPCRFTLHIFTDLYNGLLTTRNHPPASPGFKNRRSNVDMTHEHSPNQVSWSNEHARPRRMSRGHKSSLTNK